MNKKLLGLVTAAMAFTGCGSLVGPDETEANSAKAKQALEAASRQPAPSTRVSGN